MFRLTPLTIRIIAFQVLFLGLLFLPHYSVYPVSLAGADWSLMIGTLTQILDNPAFYVLLMAVAIIFMFSFDAGVLPGETTSAGAMLMKSLNRILTIYLSFVLIAWFFLIFKKMFMGAVYVNDVILAALS